MSTRKTSFTLFSILLLVGMIFSLVQPANAMVQQAASEQTLDKVEPLLLATLEAKGSTDIVVLMSEHADLSAAQDMKDWNARGWYVYNTLREFAAASQKPVIDYLEANGYSYKSFFAGNEVHVTGAGIQAVSALATLPSVDYIRTPRTAYIEPKINLTPAEVPQGDVINAYDWGIPDTNADDFWTTFGIQGSGILVANIDTGVQWDHSALDQSYKCATDPSNAACWLDPNTSDCTGTSGGPCDNNGHGTHTMGTMVGDDDPTLTYQVGMAPDATWIACKGCATNSCSDADLNACADWILAPGGNAANRPHVVNNSWGGGGGDNWYESKVQAWYAAGIFPAFSAGNAGPTCSSLGSPGDYQVSFGSASHQESRAISSFSSRGPSAAFGHDPYTKPNISAPGDYICSSVPGNSWDCSYSGTSMASPHSAGAVALLWSCNPGLIGQMTATFELLQDTADTAPDGSCGAPEDGEGNYTFGYGYLNVLAAGNVACSTGTLSGTVTDNALTPNPVADAIVTADNGAGVVVDTLTLADGSYSLNLPEGTYTLTATKYGYGVDNHTVEIVEGETDTVNFIFPQLDMSTVSGYVTDGGIEGLGSHGYPLYSSIHITATGFDETLYVDPFTGFYTIELVESTPHTFVTTAVPSGYDVLTETVTPTGAAYIHDIELMANSAACAAPGYQPDYDIFYSFESSDEGFTPGGTTSFAWGDFTSGPGEGHSGTKGIATNPAGAYNASELGWMASPVIDLSANTGTPVIQWYDWKDIESASYDWGRVDVTKDGGTTWTTVWGPVGGVTDTAYNQQTVVLDPTYNVANFQFRFYFKSDSSVQYDGWYVDDIGLIDVPMPPPTTVFSTNFDTDNGGFTVSGTTSFAWGAPTSGPGAPYSAPNVWATNLAGDYNSSESGWITSPVIDLSSYTGLAPTISFWHWNDIESTSFDWGAVEVTKDGGTTWADVSGKIGDVSPWSQKTIALDASYAVNNFQFRFYFKSDTSVQYDGWYIDDVAVTVAEPVVIAAPCIVVPGGVVAGYVYDNNTDEVLVGAGVVSPTVETATFELEGDPDNAGLYWVFQPTAATPEDVVFTASEAKYADDAETVSVVADAITRQDFYLDAGLLSFNPLALEHTMMMGDAPANETLTITNAGLADVIFELTEKDEGFAPPLSIPAFTEALPVDPRPVSSGPAPEAAAGPALAANGLFNNLLAGEPAFAADLMTDNLVYFADTSVPGTWSVIGATMTSLFSGDFLNGDFSTLYAISYDNSNLYTIDTATGAYTLVGTATSPNGNWTGLSGAPDGTLYGIVSTCGTSSSLVTVDPATGAVTDLGDLTGVGCGIDLAYNTNDDMIYIVDLVTDSLYKVDPATMTTTLVGALGANANYAQGMDFEEETGTLYWAAYTTQGELRIIDTTTGASTLVGAFPGGAEVDSFGFATGGAADVPWLSEDPVSGTVPADGSLDITVTFDPATLSQPGDYMAELKIKHDSPYTYANIPVTLHLTAPATFGTLNGTVYALEACDVNPLPLQGATVNFYDDLGVLVASATTLADGSYTWALEAGTYDIEVLAAGYIDQMMEDVVLAEGATVTTDFTLRLDAPCITVTPEFLEESLMPDTTKTVQLTLENIGAAAGDFEIAEFEAALLNADVELILDDGSRDNGIGIGGSSQFIFLNRFTPPADAYPFELTEIQVFFGSEDLVTVGDEMKLVVYENVTGNTDPAVGSNYLAGFPVTVQSVGAWNIYTLPEPVMLFGPGDVLIGVIALELPGSSYYPAAIDETATQERSWAGWWTTPTAPEVPTLPPDSDWTLIDAYFPGNWMVRGMGSSASADIVWLSEDPVAGTVPADSSLDVDVTFDATGMALGDYNARLRVAGMATGSVFVPVTMHVVSDLNQAPVAVADAYTMNEDTILTIDAPGVLNNDSDPDSDPITAVLVSDVTNGTLALAADGSFVYTPDADYFGTDTFTYKANDGELDSNVVTVTITINDVPDVRYIFLPIILK